MNRLLIVRLGSLGDLVHTLPAVAAIRRAYPDAEIDWLVDRPHAGFLGLVPILSSLVVLQDRTSRAWLRARATLRARQYDAALDFQGLMKSAVLARASGAARVAGFSIWHLREKGARPFYSETGSADEVEHVVQKNLQLLRVIGIETARVEFPLRDVSSPAAETVRAAVGSERVLELGAEANRFPPELAAFDRYGRRLDEVRFHPAYHELMALAMEHRIHDIAWIEETARGRHVGHMALLALLPRPRPGRCARST